MARIAPDLQTKVSEEPQQTQKVVVTLAKGAEKQANAIVMADANAKEVAPGVYSTSMTGEQLLELAKEDAIAEIDLDFQVWIQ